MIRLVNVSKTYNSGKKDELEVLKNVNVTFPDNGIIALCGRSGSGKTTLLNMIGGLLHSDNGEIAFDEDSVDKGEPEDRIQHIGYVFQNYCLNEDRTVFENVADALRISGMTDEKCINECVNKSLMSVKMDAFAGRYPGSLSGGQQQRVAVARAIVKKPKVILADEPTGNLDENNKNAVMKLLRQISRECLVILVTHSIDLVEQYCDGVIYVKDGLISDLEMITPTCLEAKRPEIDLFEKAEEGAELSGLPDKIETGKQGRVYTFRNAVSRGWNTVYGKRAKNKTLRRLLLILGIAFVLVAAFLGNRVRKLIEPEPYQDHMFIGYISNEKMAKELEQFITDKKNGIDGYLYNDYVDFGVNSLQVKLSEFESSLVHDQDHSPYYGMLIGYTVPLRFLGQIADVNAEKISLSENEVVITVGLANQLIEKRAFSYLTKPEDLIGMTISSGSDYRIAGVIDSNEAAMAVNDIVYDRLRYRGQFLDTNFLVADQGLNTGEVVIVKNRMDEDSSESAPEKVCINGVQLNVAEIRDVYFPYEKWLTDIKKETKNTMDESAWDDQVLRFKYYAYYLAEYEEYLKYCRDNREIVFYDRCMEEALNGNRDMLLWLATETIGERDYYYAAKYYEEHTDFPNTSIMDQVRYEYEYPFMELDMAVGGALSDRENTISYYLSPSDFTKCAASFGKTEGYGLKQVNKPRAYVYLHSTDLRATEEFARDFFVDYDRSGFSYLSPIAEAKKERTRLLKEEAFTLFFLGVLVLTLIFVIYLCVGTSRLKYGKEYAVYRCIGVSKRNIKFGFSVEMTTMLLSTLGLGLLLTTGVLRLLMNSRYATIFEKEMYFPVLFGVIGLLFFVLVCLVISITSMTLLLRKEPGELLISEEV